MASSKAKRNRAKQTTAEENGVSYVVLKNGNKYKMTGMDGRYYICGDRRFSASSPYVDGIYTEPVMEVSENGCE
jgi:hypothetical protein